MPLQLNVAKNVRKNPTRKATGFSLESSDLLVDNKCENDSFFQELICTTFCVIGLLALDFLFYGFLVPLVAIFIAGKFLYLTDINIGSIGETMLVVFVVFCILSAVFKGRQESFFWRQFLGGENHFKLILMIRDAANTATIVYLLYRLLHTLQQVIYDQALLPRNLHEGVLYVTLSPYFDDQALETSMNIKPSYREDYRNPYDVLNEWVDEDPLSTLFAWIGSWFWGQGSPQLNVSYDGYVQLVRLKSMAIHGAELILCVAQLTSAITKLMYFTSLFNYQRAMTLFIEMQQNGDFSNCEGLEVIEEVGETEIFSDAGNQIETVHVYQNAKSTSVHPTPHQINA